VSLTPILGLTYKNMRKTLKNCLFSLLLLSCLFFQQRSSFGDFSYDETVSGGAMTKFLSNNQQPLATEMTLDQVLTQATQIQTNTLEIKRLTGIIQNDITSSIRPRIESIEEITRTSIAPDIKNIKDRTNSMTDMMIREGVLAKLSYDAVRAHLENLSWLLKDFGKVTVMGPTYMEQLWEIAAVVDDPQGYRELVNRPRRVYTDESDAIEIKSNELDTVWIPDRVYNNFNPDPRTPSTITAANVQTILLRDLTPFKNTKRKPANDVFIEPGNWGFAYKRDQKTIPYQDIFGGEVGFVDGFKVAGDSGDLLASQKSNIPFVMTEIKTSVEDRIEQMVQEKNLSLKDDNYKKRVKSTFMRSMFYSIPSSSAASAVALIDKGLTNLVGDMVFKVPVNDASYKFYVLNNLMVGASSTDRILYYAGDLYKSVFPLTGEPLSGDDKLKTFYGVCMEDIFTCGYVRQGLILSEQYADLPGLQSAISGQLSAIQSNYDQYFPRLVSSLLNSVLTESKMDITKIKAVSGGKEQELQKIDTLEGYNLNMATLTAPKTKSVYVVFPGLGLLENWLNTYDNYATRLRIADTNQFRCTYAAAQAGLIAQEYFDAADELKDAIEAVIEYNKPPDGKTAGRDLKYDIKAQQNALIPQMLANGEKWKQLKVDLEEKALNYKKEKAELLVELGKAYSDFYDKALQDIKNRLEKHTAETRGNFSISAKP
jgi:hypothetical protein